MSKIVWVLSVLLAVAFLTVGLGKLATSSADLESAAGGIPVVLFRIAGAAEVLGALGLILPAATRFVPVLTPVAAGGLAVTMASAVVAHVATGQFGTLVLPAGLGVLASFVAWARWDRWAITGRGEGAHDHPSAGAAA